MLHEAGGRHLITYHGSGRGICREYIHVLKDAARMSVEALARVCHRHLILTGQERLRIKRMS